MPDEAPSAPVESQDTPSTLDAPEEGHAPQGEAIDYEKRYNDLRSEFDSRNQDYQRHDQYEQIIEALTDPETQADALAALGIEYDSDEADDDYDDEDLPPAVAKRLEALEQQLLGEKQTFEEQRYVEQLQEALDDRFDSLEKEIGREVDDDEVDLIFSLAEQMPDDEGIPNVKAAYQKLDGYLNKQRDTWLQSKRNAPRVNTGPGADEVIDTSTREGRVKKMERALAALDDS